MQSYNVRMRANAVEIFHKLSLMRTGVKVVREDKDHKHLQCQKMETYAAAILGKQSGKRDFQHLDHVYFSTEG